MNDLNQIQPVLFVKGHIKKWSFSIFIIVTIILFLLLVYYTWANIFVLKLSTPEIPEKFLINTIEINSSGFNSLSQDEQAIITKNAIYQYTTSSAVIFLVLILSYIIQIIFMVQNFIETCKEFLINAGKREIGAHVWYLLIIMIAFPLALAVIPEFSTDYNHFKPEILSKIVLATLTNLIVILLTAELSTLYFSLDQEILIKNIDELIKKIFKDLRFKQLLIAIVLDILTFYFISRLPSVRQKLNFESILIILLFVLTFFTLISSFGAIFTLSISEKIKRINANKN